jgi:hypothetical protein
LDSHPEADSWTTSRQVIEFSSLLFKVTCIHSFALTSYSFESVLLYTVKEKGGKPHPFPYGLRNPYRNLKSENSQECQETPKKLDIHDIGFRIRIQILGTEN